MTQRINPVGLVPPFKVGDVVECVWAAHAEWNHDSNNVTAGMRYVVHSMYRTNTSCWNMKIVDDYGVLRIVFCENFKLVE